MSNSIKILVTPAMCMPLSKKRCYIMMNVGTASTCDADIGRTIRKKEEQVSGNELKWA